MKTNATLHSSNSSDSERNGSDSDLNIINNGIIYLLSIHHIAESHFSDETSKI